MTTNNTDYNQIVAEESHESVVHVPTLYAEPIAHIGSFAVTNALFTSWVIAILIIIISIKIRFSLKQIPKGFQNLFEAIIEISEKLADQVTGDRKITNRAFPIVFTVFFIVLLNNWVGIMPVGGFGIIEITEHGKTFVPLFRSGTADINGTLPLAILSVIGANLFGIFSIGLWKTFNKYVNLGAIGEIFKKVRKEPSILISAPIMFFVGILELIGELAKVASLSFRLFGNVFAGEVLLASMGAIMAFLLPTPFILLELFIGVIQAFIFAILTLVYYTIASHDHNSSDKEHSEEKKLKLKAS